MDSKRIGIGLVAVLLLPFSALAAPLSYNYVDLDFYNAEIDGTPADDEGFALSGSALFTENFFFAGRYADSDDLQRITAGVGFQAPVAETTSAYGLLSFEDFDIDPTNQDENGASIEGGLRHALTSNFEVNGGVQYFKVDDIATFDDEFGFKVGALYSFTTNLGVKAGYNQVDDYEEFTVGGRFMF